MFSIIECSGLRNDLDMNSMAGTRSKNVIQPTALDNKLLKIVLEKEIKNSKQKI